MVKSAKFQMTIHIDNDREENEIQFLMASQTKMIRTLVSAFVIFILPCWQGQFEWNFFKIVSFGTWQYENWIIAFISLKKVWNWSL